MIYIFVPNQPALRILTMLRSSAPEETGVLKVPVVSNGWFRLPFEAVSPRKGPSYTTDTNVSVYTNLTLIRRAVQPELLLQPCEISSRHLHHRRVETSDVSEWWIKMSFTNRITSLSVLGSNISLISLFFSPPNPMPSKIPNLATVRSSRLKISTIICRINDLRLFRSASCSGIEIFRDII